MIRSDEDDLIAIPIIKSSEVVYNVDEQRGCSESWGTKMI